MREVVLTAENFEEEVLNYEGTVLIDFWAVWCGPCQMLAPVIAKIAEEHPEIKVGKVNVDEQMDLAMRYRVASIPMLLVFKNGEPVNTAVGYMPEEAVLALLN